MGRFYYVRRSRRGRGKLRDGAAETAGCLTHAEQGTAGQRAEAAGRRKGVRRGAKKEGRLRKKFKRYFLAKKSDAGRGRSGLFL